MHVEAAAASAKPVTLIVPFSIDDDVDFNDDIDINKAVRGIEKNARKQASSHGFRFVKIDSTDIHDEVVYVKFTGPRNKLFPWVRKWERSNDTDAQIEKSYKEDADVDDDCDEPLVESTHGYSKHAPKAKVKMLTNTIKSIPADKLPFVLDVIAAHANFDQIKLIIGTINRKGPIEKE